MFRIVLDTSQFVSAILSSQSTAAKVLNAWHEGVLDLVTSLLILEEIKKVLNYPMLSKIHKKHPKEINLLLEELEVLTILVPDRFTLSVITDDPRDDQYLLAALEGDAKYLITGSSHLLEMKEYREVKIITATAFLKELEEMNVRNKD